MKTRNNPRVNPSPKVPALDADEQPLSVAVLVVFADSRHSARVIEAGRDLTFGAGPEALAALPGQLHLLMQSAEADALREMNQLLAQIVQAEPEPPETPVLTPALERVLRLVPSATGIQMVLVTESEDVPTTDEYLLPLNLPPLDALPVDLASAIESPMGGE